MATTKKVTETTEVKAAEVTAVAEAPKAAEKKPATKKAAEKKPAAKKTTTTKKAAEKKPATKKAPAKKAPVLTYEDILAATQKRVKAAKAPTGIEMAAQIKVKGSVEGILYILIANGYVVSEGFDYKGAAIDIDADADTFKAIVDGDKHLDEALIEGTVKMQGNAGNGVVFASIVF